MVQVIVVSSVWPNRLRSPLKSGQRRWIIQSRLVRAAGCLWPVEEDFRSGKGCFGLDESQVRLFTAIAWHTALVMAALAICVVTAALLRRRTDTGTCAGGRPTSRRQPGRHSSSRDTVIRVDDETRLVRRSTAS